MEGVQSCGRSSGISGALLRHRNYDSVEFSVFTGRASNKPPSPRIASQVTVRHETERRISPARGVRVCVCVFIFCEGCLACLFLRKFLFIILTAYSLFEVFSLARRTCRTMNRFLGKHIAPRKHRTARTKKADSARDFWSRKRSFDGGGKATEDKL